MKARLNDETKAMIKAYIEGFSNGQSNNEVIPTIAGLALRLNITRQTLYNWAKEDEEIALLLEALKNAQELYLVNMGLKGEINAGIAKLMLMNNHSYSDRMKSEISGEGTRTIELTTPIVIERRIIDTLRIEAE